MSPLQIWNYLGLGRIRKMSFFGLGGLKIILTKFFTVYWILVWHFGTVWSRKIEICNKIFRNISSNIYSLTLPKRPISKINLCYCFFNQCTLLQDNRDRLQFSILIMVWNSGILERVDNFLLTGESTISRFYCTCIK